jgi:hypothetical protein
MKRYGPTDAAKLLLAGRPVPRGVSTRGRVPDAAGLDAVPCWVREMTDDEAFMALVLANSQSELLPLERGIHALRSGKGVREYAREVERAPSLVVRDRQAAEVFTNVNGDHTRLASKTMQLAELHATASWLWPALVERLLVEGWNADTARGHAGRLKDAPQPPIWADRDPLAQDIVAGRARANDVDRMAKAPRPAARAPGRAAGGARCRAPVVIEPEPAGTRGPDPTPPRLSVRGTCSSAP